MESPRKGHTFEAVDAEGTEHLVRAAVGSGVRRLVYISGAGAAPDAERHWFRAKWRAEQSVQVAGSPLRSSARPGSTVRATSLLNRFMTFARFLPVVPMTNAGQQRLAPVFVDDAANLAADALDDPAAVDRVLELGGPETLTMRDIIEGALRIWGLRVASTLPGPTPLLKLAAAPMSLLPTPPLTPAAIDFINQPATVDLGPLLTRMPRRLIGLDEGLRSYLRPGPDGRRTLEIDGQDAATNRSK